MPLENVGRSASCVAAAAGPVAFIGYPAEYESKAAECHVHVMQDSSSRHPLLLRQDGNGQKVPAAGMHEGLNGFIEIVSGR